MFGTLFFFTSVYLFAELRYKVWTDVSANTMFYTLRIPRVKMLTAFLECYIKYHAFLLVISSGVMGMSLDTYRAIIDSFLARRPKMRFLE